MTNVVTLEQFCQKKHLNYAHYLDVMTHRARYPKVWRPLPVTFINRKQAFRQPDLVNFVQSADRFVPIKGVATFAAPRTVTAKTPTTSGIREALEKRVEKLEATILEMKNILKKYEPQNFELVG